MNYEEIISHIARRLGHQAFANSLKADYRYALKWAESEMVHYIDLERRIVTFDMIFAPDGNVESIYNLPEDYSSPRQIRFLDSNSNEIESIEVELETFNKWNPNPEVSPLANDFLPQVYSTSATIDTARLANKIVYTVIYDKEEGWKLKIKPTTTGKIQLTYAPDSNLDIFDHLQSVPPFPDGFHHYLITGAVKYLAEVEAAQKRAQNDYQGAGFFLRIGKEAGMEWERLKEHAKESVVSRATVQQIKPFTWYDNPRRYR